MVPACRPAPPKISALRADPWGRIRIILGLQLLAALPALFFLVGYATGRDKDIGWAALGYGCFALVIGGLTVLASATEDVEHEAARLYHGEYLLADDFDTQAAGLLRRAQTAIARITNSWAGTEGLIDAPAHSVMFRRYEWDLADLLRASTTLRAADDPDLRDLGHKAAAALRRVEHLEEYARRVAALESSYLARDRIREMNAATDLLPSGYDSSTLRVLAWHAEQVEAMVRADLRDMAAAEPDEEDQSR
jgi:hypothetical protein